VYGDPDELERLARDLHGRAQQVRDAAADHQRGAEAAHWVSTAATVYRENVAQDRRDADAAADAMDAAADALMAHAQEVRDTIALIARAEREAREWISRQADRAGNVLGDLVDGVGGMLSDAGDSLIGGLRQLPAAGSVGWLDVAGDLPGGGN
jgi:hypothetical protein